MGFKIDREFILRAARKGDIEGPNEFAQVRCFVQRFVPGADKLDHDALHRLSSRVYRQLADGEELDIDDSDELPDGVPDLSLFAGSSDIERAISYLTATQPGFAALGAAEQKTQAQALLEQIQAAVDNAAEGTDEADSDPSLSDHAQAVKNLDARDASFRTLTHEERCFGPRVRNEVERVRERRLRLADERETRLLADANSVAPPKVDVQPMHRPGDDMTLARLRMYPPAPWAGVDSDVARCISYFVQVFGQAYASKRWPDQNADAVAFVNDLYRKQGVPQRASAGAR